jgi:hypothetical protein
MSPRRRRDALAALLVAALLTSAVAALAQGFALTRVELVFVNRRGDITVPHRFPSLHAYAMMRSTGAGVIQGTWRVDGRIVAAIAHPTVFGEDAILVSPELLTAEPGQHRVTVDVTNPRPAFRIPEITYFVTAQDYEEWKKGNAR